MYIANIDGIKGVKAIADATKEIGTLINCVPLYYNIEEKKVYSQPGSDRFFLTNLINPCSEKDVIETVQYVLSM